jgi:hypothetical protein
MKRHVAVFVASSFLTALGVGSDAAAQSVTSRPASAASAPATSAAPPSSAPAAAPAGAPSSGEAKAGAEAAGQTGKMPVKPAAKPAAKQADKVGFARVVPSWPKWFTLSVQERGRYESLRSAGTKGATYDGYYMNRFRLTAGFNVSPWFRASVQGQDSRVVAYDTAPVVPTSMLNSFDLRLAYVDLGRKSAKGFATSFGRQELLYGDGRLIASPDWGNVGRTYDSIRVAGYRPGVRVEAFFGAPVDVTRAFSTAKTGERLAGVWATFDKVKPFGFVEGYSFAKSLGAAVGELSVKGDAITYVNGFRIGGPVTRAVTWEAENVWETGHFGGDNLSAFGTHEAVSWTIGKSAMKPKATVEYNYASGDTNAKDGTRGTFDQIYASTHAKWGVADLVAWRNMQHAAAKFEFSPTKRLKINTALNHLWLATVQDGWYASSGTRLVLNRKATSRDLGWEPDVYFAYTLTRDLTVGAGFGMLFGGGFVTQSTDVTRLWVPYTTFTYKF